MFPALDLICDQTINTRFFGFAKGEIDFPLRKIKEKPDVQRRSFPALDLICDQTINTRFFGFAKGEIDFPLRKIKEKPDVQRRSFPALNDGKEIIWNYGLQRTIRTTYGSP